MITLKGAEYAWLSHRLTTARRDYTQESWNSAGGRYWKATQEWKKNEQIKLQARKYS